QLGHVLMGEQEEKISLLQRLLEHAVNTARYNVYYGEGRDAYDVRGRTALEAIFNTASGAFRCPNSQQGYSPFTTWTRGLAWAAPASSAAARAAQGLIRLGNYFLTRRHAKHAARYRQAGLTIANTLFQEPYLSCDTKHQGLLLHSVYHRPNGWDCIARGQNVPN